MLVRSAAPNGSFLTSEGPNEQRTISREHAGVYYAVVIGARYKLNESFNVHLTSTFYDPLYQCIERHPYLSVSVEDMHTDKSYYRQVLEMKLLNHVSIATPTTAGGDSVEIQKAVEENLVGTWSRGTPPWRIVVLPLEHGCFIAFVFSHAIGDGRTGVAFHQSLLWAIRNPKNATERQGDLIRVPSTRFPGPFDTPERLPISWSFLLSPLIAAIIPDFLSKLLGIRASASPTNSGTWVGSDCPTADELHLVQSNLIVRKIDGPKFEKILCIVKNRNAKFTGVFIQCVFRALWRNLPSKGNITNLVSQVAIDMRGSVGIPKDHGGVFAAGCYLISTDREPTAHFHVADWETARSYTEKLAVSATTLQDQMIGLLRYAPSITKWTLSRFGKPRDSSFEVSNVGVVDDNFAPADVSSEVKITDMIFAQRGHAMSAPLTFNLIHVKGSALTYTVTWQSGALNVGQGQEDVFVEKVCDSIEKNLENLF